MGYHESRKPGTSQTAAQLPYAMKVIHPDRYITTSWSLL
jgi:hypothetical protein